MVEDDDDGQDETASTMALAADRILDIVSRAPGAAAGMRELISECASRQPHPDWARVGALDWSAEVTRLEGWLTTLMRDEPAGAQITGFYFGLFNPVIDGETVADLYVAGAPRDASDPEWFCDVASHWWPKGRYSKSPLLAQIYRLAYQDEGDHLENDMAAPPSSAGSSPASTAATCCSSGASRQTGSPRRSPGSERFS